MFGSHLSIAGGMFKAILAAEKIGFGTVRVFEKNRYLRTGSRRLEGT